MLAYISLHDTACMHAGLPSFVGFDIVAPRGTTLLPLSFDTAMSVIDVRPASSSSSASSPPSLSKDEGKSQAGQGGVDRPTTTEGLGDCVPTKEGRGGKSANALCLWLESPKSLEEIEADVKEAMETVKLRLRAVPVSCTD